MAMLGKTLLSAVSAAGAGTSQDLAAMVRSVTMHVVPSAATVKCQVALEGSVDGVAWFRLGQTPVDSNGGLVDVDERVVNYIRANVLSISGAGNVSAYAAFVGG
jgi:hypothetical protein